MVLKAGTRASRLRRRWLHRSSFPGAGQVLTLRVRRGLLVFASMVSLVGMLVWRLKLLAPLETSARGARSARPLSRRPVFVALVLLSILAIWVLNCLRRGTGGAHARRRLRDLRRRARRFFRAGVAAQRDRHSEDGPEIPRGDKALRQVIWPWQAAVTRDPVLLTAAAEIQVPRGATRRSIATGRAREAVPPRGAELRGAFQPGREQPGHPRQPHPAHRPRIPARTRSADLVEGPSSQRVPDPPGRRVPDASRPIHREHSRGNLPAVQDIAAERNGIGDPLGGSAAGLRHGEDARERGASAHPRAHGGNDLHGHDGDVFRHYPLGSREFSCRAQHHVRFEAHPGNLLPHALRAEHHPFDRAADLGPHRGGLGRAGALCRYHRPDRAFCRFPGQAVLRSNREHRLGPHRGHPGHRAPRVFRRSCSPWCRR